MPAVPLLISAAALFCGLVYFTGGGTAELFGVRLSSRNPANPFFILLTLTIAWLAVRRRRAFGDVDAARNAAARHGWAFAVAAGAIAAWVSWSYGAHVAGGTDSYGYLSQAQLWIERGVIQPVPLAGASWDGHAASLAPLGYRVTDSGTAIVPIYAAGLPLLMATVRLAFGACAPFLVTPAAFGVLVLTTWLLGRDLGGRGTAVAGALLLAASPAILHAAMWPMSDVPVAALWTLALWLAFRNGMRSAVLAGLAAGAATMVRPNLLLVLVAFIAGMAILERGRRLLWPLPRRAIAAALAAAPFVIAAAAIQDALYGSPLRSGYGPVSYLYQLSNIGPNLLRYGSQLIESQTPVVLLACIPFFSGFARRRAVMLALFIGAWIASYLPYAQFEEWWYLRFFSGLFPILAFASILGLRRLLPRRDGWPTAAAWIATILLMLHGLAYAIEQRVFRVHEREARYLAAAQYVDATLPSNAAIIASQHSGSLRYHAGRLTVRFDLVGPNALEHVLADLQRLGYRPYVLLDVEELEAFTSRFAGNGGAGRLAVQRLAATRSRDVQLYDPLAEGPQERPPAVMPGVRLDGCPPAARPGHWLLPR